MNAFGQHIVDQLADAYRAAAMVQLQQRAASMPPKATPSVFDAPVAPVDVVDLRKRMTAAATVARTLATQLDDVASIAYEVTVGERVGASCSSEGHAHTSTGDRRAKVALAKLDHALGQFTRSMRDVERVASSGVVDTTLRGTMLGDGSGAHPADTLRDLRKAQARRRERGEYTPSKIVDQPSLPDNRKGSSTRSKSKKRRKR